MAVTDNHASYTLLYLLFGMALTSIALEVAANYLRKVHFMGRKMCNAPSVAVHFGGKDLTVSELFWAFGRENGLHDDVMLKFICRMDDFVATTIAQKESGELRKPNILLRKSLLCENLGVSSGDISFADDSESEV